MLEYTGKAISYLVCQFAHVRRVSASLGNHRLYNMLMHFYLLF